MGSKLVSAIARSDGYSAIERTSAFLSELAKEQKYQRTGAVDDTELSRLGKQFGVQLICVANVINVFGGQYLSARLIDVENAQVKSTSSSSGTISTLDDLIRASESVSSDLLSKFYKADVEKAKKVAVYVTPNELTKEVNQVLGDKLVAGFTSSGRYVAVERTNSFLSQIGKEQKYQRTGAVSDGDISRLGKQSGVRYVCVADISEVLGEKFVSARLIDVETAEVVNSYDAGGKMNSIKDCISVANRIASELSKGTIQEQKEEQERRRAEQERVRAELREAKEKAIAEEKAREQAIEEANRKEFDKIKDSVDEALSKGYVTVETEDEVFMVCLEKFSEMSYKEASNLRSYCGGYSDWRLPTYTELHKLCNSGCNSLSSFNVKYEAFKNNIFLSDSKYWCIRDGEKWFKRLSIPHPRTNNVYDEWLNNRAVFCERFIIDFSPKSDDLTSSVGGLLTQKIKHSISARPILIRKVR